MTGIEMKKLFLLILLMLFTLVANAHFLTLLPSTDNVSNNKEATLQLTAMFIHPFEQTGMTMEKPKGLYVDSTNRALVLTQTQKLNHKAWKSSYKIKKPGVYQFFVKPKPYFEAPNTALIP